MYYIWMILYLVVCEFLNWDTESSYFILFIVHRSDLYLQRDWSYQDAQWSKKYNIGFGKYCPEVE